jgi:predicted GNAT family N-acyltransferase
VRRARWAGLDTATAQGLFALRAAVEPPAAGTVALGDEHDPEPATEHVWVADADGPLAALRVRSAGPGGTALVERLCVRADVRQRGLPAALLADVVARYGAAALVADVPAEQTGTFAPFGFEEVATVPDAGAAGIRIRMRRRPDRPWRED